MIDNQSENGYDALMSEALLDFANDVGAAIARVPQSGRFGSRKVFISSIWRVLVDTGRTALALDGFKVQLLAAQRAGQLSLARADLVAAMPKDSVIASEIECDGATWHFAIDPQARDGWA